MLKVSAFFTLVLSGIKCYNFSMKKLVISLFMLQIALSLFGQTFREARIFVPPVDGAGVAGDNNFFYKQLTYEVVLQYHSLVRTRRSSDFILRGTVAPYTGEEQFLIDHPQEEPEYFGEETAYVNPGPVPSRPIPRIRNTFGRREFFSWEVDGEILFFDTSSQDNYQSEEPEPVYYHESEEQDTGDYLSDTLDYVFSLELISNITGDLTAKQYLIYRFADAAVAELVSIMVYNMLTNIPDIEADIDWREKWLFAEVTAMWAPRIYTGQEQSVNWVNFGIGASLEYHFLDFMSASLGFQLVQDWVVVTRTTGDEYRDLMLELPLAVRFPFKPLQLMLEPYGGVSLNFSLMGVTQPSVLSWFVGFQFGAKAGPGMVVIDPRFSMDFFNSVITGRDAEYQRYLIQLSVGYKFGFLPKHPRRRDY